MPSTGYLLSVLIIALVVTFSLRAIPFLILKPLRESEFVSRMALWMPAGVLAILAVITFHDSAFGDTGNLWAAITAAAITVAVHLLGGRRTLLSVGLGTLTFVLLVNLL